MQGDARSFLARSQTRDCGRFTREFEGLSRTLISVSCPSSSTRPDIKVLASPSISPVDRTQSRVCERDNYERASPCTQLLAPAESAASGHTIHIPSSQETIKLPDNVGQPIAPHLWQLLPRLSQRRPPPSSTGLLAKLHPCQQLVMNDATLPPHTPAEPRAPHEMRSELPNDETA